MLFADILLHWVNQGKKEKVMYPLAHNPQLSKYLLFEPPLPSMMWFQLY